MIETRFHDIAVRNPRIAPFAAATQPAWLWSFDGATILWANAAGAAALRLADHRPATVRLSPTDPHRRQVAQLARTLPSSGATRLERMRGFGAMLGHLATCACARLELADGETAMLIASVAPMSKPIPLAARLQFVLDGFDAPAAGFAADGAMIGTNRRGRRLFADAGNLASLGLDAVRDQAFEKGRAEITTAEAHFELCRIGTGDEAVLLALATPAVADEEDVPMDEPFADEVLVDEDADDDETSTPSGAGDQPATAKPDAAPAPIERERPATPMTSLESSGPAAAATTPPSGEFPMAARKQPLRFLWQMDAESRFSLGSDEFSKLIGPLAAAALGRPWHEVAAHFRLDPAGQVARAVAARETWSGVVIDWPINDAGDVLPIELSGLPIYDHDRNFAGYRGFGVCRDLARLEHLADLRRQEGVLGAVLPRPQATGPVFGNDRSGSAPPPQGHDTAAPEPHHAPIEDATADLSPHAPTEPSPSPAPNVVPFRPNPDAKAPGLSAVENHAFDEIARRLSARLDRAADEVHDEALDDVPARDEEPPVAATHNERPPAEAAAWLAPAAQPAQANSGETKLLLDRVPTGVLIYRLDRLLYANAAFFEHVGFENLHALSEAGGLDALYVDPVSSSSSSSSEEGTPLKIAAPDSGKEPSFARLFTISWDGEQAMALIFAPAPDRKADPVELPQNGASSGPGSPANFINDDLAAIIDTAADGVVLFDREGNILSCNHSATILFNEPIERLTQRNLADLFALESQSVVLAYYESLDDSNVMDHGREVLGQVRGGGLIPLSMTMGRTTGDGDRYFAVFRDLSQLKKNEADLQRAKRRAEHALEAKADTLAKISHEIREPLNAIIGFAEGMLEQRFGPLGSERYSEYMRDIRVAGERVLAIVNDVLDLSRIEAGKRELTPAKVNLNDLIAQCVGTMQPHANRQRIIIRSSLGRHLPPVSADAQSLHQMIANLIASSIHLANPGGQVIVSTALTDDGEVALRVRDTGHGLSDRDLAAVTSPHRGHSTEPGEPPVPETSSVNFALSKALAEANRAQFAIKRAPNSGTLIEVTFPRTIQALAQAQ